MFLKNYVNIYYNFLLLYNKKKIVSNNYFNYNLIQNNYSLNIYNFIDVVLLKNFFNFKFLRYRFRLYFYVFLYLFKNNYMSMLPNKINFNKIFNICSFIKTSILFDNYFNCYKGLICYFLFFKDRKYNYFKKILINKSSFFFKNKIFININKKYFILNNDTYMSYAYIFTNFLSYNFQNSLKLNNSLVLLGDKLKPHNFNYFYNFSNVTNKNFNYFYSNSNYSLNMFKYYTLHNNIKSNSIFTNYIKSFFFFEIFLKKFFELKFNKSIYLVLKKNNVTYLNNNIYYLSLIKRLKKLQIFNKQANLVREVVEVLTLAFFTHDIILLRNWLINVSEKLHFKSHKKLFYILKVIVIKYFNLYFKYFGCLGFCLKIKGKIGLGGSSKTKSFWIKVGKFSLSKKNLKITYASGSIRTYSGILGLELILSYL